MIRKNFIRTLCIWVFGLMASSNSLCAQTGETPQNVSRHTVQAGETLYHLSHELGVTQEQILALNPGVTAQNLRAGQELLVPVSGQTDSARHKVKKKETLWSISQAYGITLDELVAANPEAQVAGFELKEGDVLVIPVRHGMTADRKEAIGYGVLRLGVVLPFKADGAEADRCTEFFRGFLMAVEEVKNQGKDVVLYVYNEPAGAGFDSLLHRLKQHNIQMIVGPLYPDHFEKMARFCKENGMKCLVPFSSKVDEVSTTPELFLLNAPDENKAEYAVGLLRNVFNPAQTKVVLLPTEDGNELNFVSQIRQRLLSQGYVITELPKDYTLAQMQNGVDNNRTTLFLPTSSSRQGAIKVFSELKQLRAAQPKASTALLGYTEWLDLAGEFQNDLFAIDTYIISNHYYNIYDAATRQFEQNYTSWFHQSLLRVSPRMALLGYDAGRYIMEGLLQYGEHFGIQDLTAPHYQSAIRFIRPDGASGGYVNGNILLVHYRTDRTIEKIAIQ